MKKLALFSLLICSVAQINAMDPNKLEKGIIKKEDKSGEAINKEGKSVSTYVAEDSLVRCRATIKKLRRNIRHLKTENGELTQQNQEQAEHIKKLTIEIRDLKYDKSRSLVPVKTSKPYFCNTPNCKCGR